MAELTDSSTVDQSLEDIVLEIRDASVTFDMERGQSRVLNEVDLDVERGEILGVVGESGSGKSMFASALLDAVVDPGVLTGDITYYPDPDEPTEVLQLSKRDLKRFRWEEIAMVFQGAQSSFNPTITIREHVEETLDTHGYDEQEGMERARQLLSDLYLDPERALNSYPHELSGGMKQRALIALSLVLQPEVLVMDEPTAALDLLMQRSIIALLDDLQSSYDLTLIFITHDLPLVAELADRLAVMYAFEFCEIAPANRIVTGANHPYTRALINSTPNLDTPVDAMRPIAGESPDPVNVPEGCSYHPRCPMADDRCVIEDPGLYSVESGHHAACHYWEDVDSSIPLSIQEYRQVEDTVDRAGASDEERTASPDPRSGDPVVSLDDVEVHFEQASSLLQSLFSDPDTVQAVDGVDLDIYERDVVALVGESGCGKTTLGKAAVGLQRPTGGSINYRDHDIWEVRDGNDSDIEFDDIRRSLQIIHQDPGSSLNPNKTVLSSLARPLKIWEPDLSYDDREARIYGMLERVGMTPATDYANRYPHQLSGGEKQRVALIRALLMNPDLILADEAVSALDVSLRVDMMDLMLDLQDQFNTSFLFISHNLSNARYMVEKAGGRIGIMYLGEIVEFGSAEAVLDDPEHPYTQVLKWATADLDPEQRELERPPIRKIDIPDPVNPPSGCRFHTRCPEAREVCAEETPELHGIEGREQTAACFRTYDDHAYWESTPLEGATETFDSDPAVESDD